MRIVLNDRKEHHNQFPHCMRFVFRFLSGQCNSFTLISNLRELTKLEPPWAEGTTHGGVTERRMITTNSLLPLE